MGKISREDRVVIKALQVEKSWAHAAFWKNPRAKAGPDSRSCLDRLITKIDNKGLLTDRIIGRGCRRSVRTTAKIRACRADLQSWSGAL